MLRDHRNYQADGLRTEITTTGCAGLLSPSPRTGIPRRLIRWEGFGQAVTHTHKNAHTQPSHLQFAINAFQ